MPVARAMLTAGLIALTAAGAAAQGRVTGVVKDESGQPIKGASVRADNPDASPSTFTATTDDKGRFGIIGLRSGEWIFTAEAPGFEPERGRAIVRAAGGNSLGFALKRGAPPPPSILGAVAAKDLQLQLGAADALFNQQRWDDAIAAYRTIMSQAPTLSVINLQIAAAYRNKKDYDGAIAAYNDLLKVDPNNDKAKVGIAMTNLEKGDMSAAEATLQRAADGLSPTRDVFYNLGEVKFVKGQLDEAARWYQKAAESDPTWGKPLLKLGLVALNHDDKAGARQLLDRILAVDPVSPEAAQAKTVLEQLNKE